MKRQTSSNSLGRICFILLFLAACSAPHSQSSTPETPADSLVHDPYSAQLLAASAHADAKDFKTKLLNGSTFQLSSQKGKIVVLNIWATWCPPCVGEMADLVSVYKKYQSKGVVFLGISVDKQGPSVVKPFVEKHNVTYPVTIDDGTIMDKYGPVMGIPTTYIIDQQGALQYFATGALTQQELQPRLDKLLRERKKVHDVNR